MDGEQLVELDESAKRDGETLLADDDDIVRQVEEARAEQTADANTFNVQSPCPRSPGLAGSG